MYPTTPSGVAGIPQNATPAKVNTSDEASLKLETWFLRGVDELIAPWNYHELR